MGHELLGFKIACIAGWAAIAAWMLYYTRHASWLKDRIGKSLMSFAALIGGLLLVTTLSLFFKFNRQTSEIAAWVDVALIGAVCPVMLWRTWIFHLEIIRGRREHDREPEN